MNLNELTENVTVTNQYLLETILNEQCDKENLSRALSKIILSDEQLESREMIEFLGMDFNPCRS